MSKLIKKWQQVLYSDTIQYNKLYDDKLITEVTGGSKHEDSLIYFLNNEVYPMNFSLSDIFAVFNRAVHLPNNHNSEQTLKNIEFYKAFNNNTIKQNKYVLSQKKGSYEDIIYVTKFGIYQNTCNFKRTENPCYKSNLQLPHDFFFYGPRVPELSFKVRNEIKSNIKNALTISSINKDILSKGFKLFNYDKVKELSFLYEQGLEGKYLKTYDKTGKVVYGGWSNPREGGENTFSLESIYYRSESLYIDQVFKNNIMEIKDMLEST